MLTTGEWIIDDTCLVLFCSLTDSAWKLPKLFCNLFPHFSKVIRLEILVTSYKALFYVEENQLCFSYYTESMPILIIYSKFNHFPKFAAIYIIEQQMHLYFIQQQQIHLCKYLNRTVAVIKGGKKAKAYYSFLPPLPPMTWFITQ